MAKKKVESQIVNLTPDHYKSGITLTSLCVGGVPHIFGKLSMRATTLLYTSPESEVFTQSYGLAGVLILGILGLPLGSFGTKMTFGCWSRGQAQSIL